MLSDYLADQQRRLILSDADFAARLRLDAETWQALRAGQATYSAAVIARILQRFPNALPQALDELRQSEAPLPLHPTVTPDLLPSAA